MINFLDEKEAQKAKQILEHQLSTDPTVEAYNYSSNQINWLNEKGNWIDALSKSKEISMQTRNGNEKLKLFFIAYPNNKIVGKPQLVYQTKQKISLLKYFLSEKKDGSLIHIIKGLEERYDQRYEGLAESVLALDFWVYLVRYENKEYYVLSDQEIPLQACEINGMLVPMNDLADVKKNLKLKTITDIFFAKDFKPVVRITSKDEIVEMTKHIDWQKWRHFLNSHPLGTINQFPHYTDLIRTAQLLSGKIDGWPMHLAVMGVQGTRKSSGYIETTANKFTSDPQIVEGANSRIKGLSPSFKEKPANIGYLAKCERMGWIDELGKMVEQEINKHQAAVTNVLGELNFLLDNKKRTVGSGNDNDCVVQATGKFLFATNPVKGMKSLGDHIGLIDPTTMSRIVWWVQDKEEVDFVMSKDGILRFPPTPTQEVSRERREIESISYVLGEVLSNIDFLTLYDTCNSFICEMDEDLIKSIVQNSINQAKEPMRAIWRSRAEHHVRLIVDGVCKTRCLFKNHTVDFKANEQDYAEASKLINKMIAAWETNLDIKDFTKGVL